MSWVDDIWKKAKKIVKKVAPVLIVAAAVYFGGSYLMASASQVPGAAASTVGFGADGFSITEGFTKSAGVWKSFLGGLSSGTASQSAVAFAEASYKASQTLGMPLSGQIAAGTSAVNYLSSGVSTSQAISQGVSLADQAFKNGSNVQSSWDILWNGLDKTVGSFSAPADPASAPGLLGENPADFSVNNEGLFGPKGTAMADATQLEGGQAATGSSVAGTDSGAMSDASVANQTGGMITGENLANTTEASVVAPAVVDPASVEQPKMPSMWDLILEERQRSNDMLQASIELGKAEIEARTKADNWKLGLTASGLFLNAFGQYQQARSAEKQERNRFMTTPALEEAFKNAYSI